MHLFQINWKCAFISVSASGNFIPWEMREGIVGKMLSMYLNFIDVDQVKSALKP